MLEFYEYKELHSEVIMYCQIIENDIKWIYSFMHKGDEYELRDTLAKKNLGQMITMLKKLDQSDGNPMISASDYNFLNQMREKRNYWCHENYIEFMYVVGFFESNEYDKSCRKLIKDHDKLESVYKNVEQVKLKAKEIYKK
ncbi:hypothetical protein LJC17_02945 [Acholeplasma sp. OttesenSCG-928-E16]|nr:hypothetical protein [Acholeplasma sp. OttesenSCG-928-E16]